MLADSVPGARSVNETALRAVEKYGGVGGARLVSLIAAGQLVAPVVRFGWRRFRDRERFTVTVAGTDELYPHLHAWVLERMPQKERKALIAAVGDADGRTYDPGGGRPAPEVRLRYDGSRSQEVTVEGHTVEVEVSREEFPGRERLPDNWRQMMEKITFTSVSVGGRDAVVRMMQGLADEKYQVGGPPPFWVPSRWGGSWNRKRDLQPRTLDSVVLKYGQLERLVGDLERFLGAEDEYRRSYQPWHRGYLFFGEPGTGKTSVAQALANHFDMATYYLPLGDLDSDADLMGLVGSIEPRSLLLMEDVDCFHAATERSEEQKSSSVAGMLNALDGVWTPHGLVTVMTTNNRGALDEALLRKGRVDVEEEFGVLDIGQAERLSGRICGSSQAAGLPSLFVGQSPAELIGALRDLDRDKELV